MTALRPLDHDAYGTRVIHNPEVGEAAAGADESAGDLMRIAYTESHAPA